MMTDAQMLHEMRPDILGATLAIEPDGTYTETVAFTDEESARKGEAVMPPDNVRADLEYAMQGATFYDLQTEALALAGLMLIAMTLAVRRFRRTLD